MTSPTITWWTAREPGPVHLALIEEALRRHKKYFRGAKLIVRTDGDEPVNTVRIDGDAAMEIQAAQFLHLTEDVLE